MKICEKETTITYLQFHDRLSRGVSQAHQVLRVLSRSQLQDTLSLESLQGGQPMEYYYHLILP